MVQFAVTNLQTSQASFDVPSTLGKWEFTQAQWYPTIIKDINEKGAMGNTYLATNMAINFQSDSNDLKIACDEIIDVCLVLSFLNARCVAPSGTTAFSQPQFLKLGDKFIRPRAIAGFDELTVNSLAAFFQPWLTTMYPAFKQRELRLQLVHWLSGCTCFCLEDLYQSIGVQFDLVKQREIAVTGQRGMHFHNGMISASTRYGLTALSHDFTKMRNDIIHEGVLSGSNFPNKSKADCADITANALNWLDSYILSVLSVNHLVLNSPRWKSAVIQMGLPALTV
jgi:hypothetical protein